MIEPMYIRCLCDWKFVPYKFKQKMRLIQSYMIDLCHLSHKQYYLYIDETDALLVDTLYNKIVWQVSYGSSMVVLLYLLTELIRFWKYENKIDTISNQVEFNDYLSLKKKYNYERKK